MNHDENKPDVQTWIEPELEARVVAWVSGESSAFESAELERIVGEKPELAIFKRRIEAVHGLVAVAVRPDDKPLRLSPERRAKLLQTLAEADGPAGSGGTAPVSKKPDAPAVFPLYGSRQQNRRRWRRTATIAAGLMLGLFFSTLIKYSGFNDGSQKEVALIRKEREANERAERGYIQSLRTDERTSSLKSAAEEGRARSRMEAYRREAEEMKREASEKRRTPDDPDVRSIASSPTPGLPEIPAAPAQPDLEKQQALSATNALPLSDGTPDRGAVVLSPFQVNEQRESLGYAASGTLSASRRVVDLNDVAGPMTAIKDLRFAPAVDSLSSAADSKDEPAPAEAKSAELDGKLAFAEAPPASKTWSADTDSFGAGVIYGKAKGGAEFTFNTPARSILAPRPGAQMGQKEEDSVVMAPFAVTSAGRSEKPVPASTVTAQQLRPQPQDTAIERLPTDLRDDNSPAVQEKKQIAKPASAPATILAEPDLTAEISAAKQSVSTFSLHVSDVSFRLAQAALMRGEMPDPDRIRPEEFYNAFNYGDPSPAMAEKVACHIEQSAHPMLQQRNLVRIAMRVPAVGRGATQPLRLTVMLDTSGSMEREDRAAAVHRALEVLVSLLGPNDRLTVIGFARQPHLLVDDLPGNRGSEALATLAHTPSEGGTDLEAALKLASELALRHHQSAAQNRIVLLTDGAANLGDANPAHLASSVEALRQQGVAFDACGVGLDGIDDAMLESLTRKGDGRYYVLNTPEAADAGFARQLAGAFRPAAENVKVQVRFNPARVGAYRLIGFEQHRLKEEDFRNDKVDAAELAADEAAVAVYQVETLPQGEGEVGEVYVRFRDASNGNMVERSWTMSYDPQVPAFDRAAPSMQLAGVATLLAEKLRGGALGDAIKLDELAPVVNSLRGRYAHEPRVQELVTMYEQLRRMKQE